MRDRGASRCLARGSFRISDGRNIGHARKSDNTTGHADDGLRTNSADAVAAGNEAGECGASFKARLPPLRTRYVQASQS
jgi:hypothetical protein